MTYKEARERMDRHIEKSTATRGYDGDKAAAWVEIKLLKELLKDDNVNEQEGEKMKYSVVERKIKTGEEEEALTKIEKYEQEDREEGTYEEDFYDIVNEEHQTIAQEENKVKFMVNFYDPETGATSPIDNIEEAEGYTAEQYIEDCKSNADDDWNKMLASGTVTLVEVDE